MKFKIYKIVAVIMAAFFILSMVMVNAAPSYEKANKDYRNIDVLSTQNIRVNKPTAQFAANRVVNGEVTDMAISYVGYDCNAEIPTLICYVGDILTFTDMSRDNNGGKIVEWDWQRYGSLNDAYGIYNSNIVNSERYVLDKPGETIFYLCVKSDVNVKYGCCAPWSENGNHQTVGRNQSFPEGAYWYFTAVRVVVKPIREALVHVRYCDVQNNKLIYEETVNAGKIYEDTQTIDTSVHVKDCDGYEYQGWDVQLMDGTNQYSGSERAVGITLAGWVPEKYLNVKFFPIMETEVEIRYWDKSENILISSEKLTGEKVAGNAETQITANIKTPERYKTDGWNVQLLDGTIQYEGSENPTSITLNGYLYKKYLNVKCYPLNNKKVTVNYIDSETDKAIKTTVIRPNQGDEELITTEVDFENVPGYVIEDWTLKTPDGVTEKAGTESPVYVTLTDKNPHKILDVNCFTLDDEEEDVPKPNPTVTIKPSGVCDGVIEWTETDSHRVIIGYTKKGTPIFSWCNHSFKYKSVLSGIPNVTPTTLKSGYGFEIDVNCVLNTSLVSNTGGCSRWGNGRRPSATVKNPTTATVYVPWDMTNRLGSQSRSISMISSGANKFTLPESSVSEIGAKKIYTPVELSGTKEVPQSHSFEIYIGGGGIGDVEFCLKLIESITINGDMYEDDFSGAN